MFKRYLCLIAAGFGCGNDGSGTGGNVTVKAALAPSAVIAYRDADGPWATKTGADTPFSFAVHGGVYSVAIACERSVEVYELTVDEMSTLDYGRECADANETLSGPLLGAGSATTRIQWGQAGRGGANADGTTYTAMGTSGTHDLLATRGSPVVDRLVIVRDVTAPPDPHATLDFDGVYSVVPERPTISAFGQLSIVYVSGDTSIGLGTYSNGLSAVVPEAAMGEGDLQLFYTSMVHGLDAGELYSTLVAARTPPTSVPLPSRIDDQPTVTWTAAGSYAALQASWVTQPDAVLYDFSSQNWRAHVSPGAFDATGMLELPDLSTVAGWDPTLGLRPGSPPDQIDWSVVAVTGASLEEVLRPLPSAEGMTQTAGWLGVDAVSARR